MRVILPIVIDSSAPTTGDDKLSGFHVGMLWLHGEDLYICTDNASGAADWTEVGSGGGGGGTVSSVGMTVPTFLSVAGSPITTSGTLAVTLATQTAKFAFMGPTSGAAAAPTFRAITKEDVQAALLGALVAGANVTITDNADGTYTIASTGGGGGGSVSTVSVVTANGVSGSVANATTTPAITLTLGAITPSSVASTGLVTGTNIVRGTGTPEGAVTAAVGTIFQRTDGGAGTTQYIKESGAGNTGWVAVASGGGSAPFSDVTALVKNDSDATKTAKMLCSAQSTGVDMTLNWGAQTADRTLNVPVLTATATLAILEQSQTFSGAKTFTDVVTASKEMSGTTVSTTTAALLLYAPNSNNMSVLFQQASGAAVKGGIVCHLGNGYNIYGSQLTTRFHINASGGTAIFDSTWERFRIDSTDVTCYSTNLVLSTVGFGFKVKEGTNATMGVATLVAGTVTVSTTKVTANSRIQLTPNSLGTVTRPKAVGVSARTAGTSFTIMSDDATDTSTVAWIIVEPS